MPAPDSRIFKRDCERKKCKKKFLIRSERSKQRFCSRRCALMGNKRRKKYLDRQTTHTGP